MTTEHSGAFVQEAPIAEVLRVGNTIYIAGQVAMLPNGDAHAPGDHIRQAEKIFEIMAELLAEEGASLQNVVKLTTYFSIPLNRQVSEEHWDVRRRAFGDHRPTSTGVQVAALFDDDYVIEIDGIAVIE